MATNALPGDVAQVVLGRYATPSRLETLRAELDLNQPLVVRYVHWLGDAVTGNLGNRRYSWPTVRGILRFGR